MSVVCDISAFLTKLRKKIVEVEYGRRQLKRGPTFVLEPRLQHLQIT